MFSCQVGRGGGDVWPSELRKGWGMCVGGAGLYKSLGEGVKRGYKEGLSTR